MAMSSGFDSPSGPERGDPTGSWPPRGSSSAPWGVCSAFVREERFRTLLVALFAVSAVLLAAVRLGGTISRLVTQRHREWGVRAALGATPRRLLAGIVLRGLVPATLGVGLGLVVALGAGRFLAPFMFGVSTWDPATYFAVACLLVSIGGVASYVPARRVLRLNPRDALVSH